ncbi:hypothetical protein [Paenibacillus sp.]|uniref:hypothetical protein n=1 Tax=Paenibacillus sp. TaxID=58172 RepID=UPI002D6D6A5F|nr:hypothetical protein [Paenibacillus sp.]HZG55149.1 hypothetical protein [Paenibacillus sp.]
MDLKHFRFYCQAGNLGMICECLADMSAGGKETYNRIRAISGRLPVEQELNVVVAIVEALGDIGAGPEAASIRRVTTDDDHPYVRFVGERALLRLGAGEL